jgi:hypothetical protein
MLNRVTVEYFYYPTAKGLKHRAFRALKPVVNYPNDLKHPKTHKIRAARSCPSQG